MRTHRRFTLLDMVALIAASAVGFAWMRALRDHPLHPNYRFLEGSSRLDRLWAESAEWIPCLMTSTLAVAVLHFRRPRPSLVRLGRRPGLVACVAASVPLVAEVALKAIRAVRHYIWYDVMRMPYPRHYLALQYRLLPNPDQIACGMAVAVGWTVLLFGRRWRAEPDGLDRLGRALGVSWIAWAALDAIWPQGVWL